MLASSRLYSVYYLHASDDVGNYRYVGITSDVKGRLSAHRRLKGKEGAAKEEWTKCVIERGAKVLMFVFLSDVSFEEASKAEVEEIKRLKSIGFDLVNGNSGGAKGYTPNDDVRARLSRAAKGFKHSPETIERMRVACRHIPSDESRALMVSLMGKRGPRRGNKYKGVTVSKKGHITGRSAGARIGNFSSEEEAAIACDVANYAYYGASCYLNFPEVIHDIRSLFLLSHSQAIELVNSDKWRRRRNLRPWLDKN